MSAWFLPGAFAARGSLGSSVFTLKRREDVRGSDVRRLCSCFRLLADSGRWRSDRSKRVRLRLSGCARSSSRPFLGLRVTGRQERLQPQGWRARGLFGARSSVEGVSGRESRRPSRGDGDSDLGRAVFAHSWVHSAWRRSVRGEPHVQSPSRTSPRLSDAANRSVSRRREPRGASRPVGAKPRRETISTERTGTRL